MFNKIKHWFNKWKLVDVSRFTVNPYPYPYTRFELTPKQMEEANKIYKEKGTIDIQPVSNIYNNDKSYKDKGNLDNNIKIISEESIIFNGKEFKNYKRINMYNTKRKIKKIIYKCINMRKNEKLMIEIGQKKIL